MLDGRTNRKMSLLDAPFKGVSIGFGLQIVEVCVDSLSKRLIGRVSFSLPKSSFGSHKLCKMINHLAKLLQKVTWKPTQSHATTIFCNHLAKMLQKIAPSQKTQHHMLLLSNIRCIRFHYEPVVWKGVHASPGQAQSSCKRTSRVKGHVGSNISEK